MTEYFGVITSELGSPSNNYVVEQIFHHNKDELVKYCEKYVDEIKSTSYEADYYIYKLIEGIE